jgi:hypothetical protein
VRRRGCVGWPIACTPHVAASGGWLPDGGDVMKRRFLVSLAIVLIATAGCTTAGTFGVGVDVSALPPGPGGFDFFFDALSPYGTWMDLAPWGEVWIPDEVPAGWRPYSMGRWVDSDDGWLWLSDFDWGWAPFHYGRWAHEAEWGWVWVPGRVWGPAWVAWRSGDGLVGWAPLPPSARWIVGMGLDTDFDYGRIPHRSWVFVAQDDLLRPVMPDRIVPRDRDDIYLRHTHNVTRYGVANGRPVDRGVRVARLEKRLGRSVSRYRVVPGSAGQRGLRAGEVHVYRPRFTRPRGQISGEARNLGRARAPYLRRHIEQQQRLAARQARERQALRRRQLEASGSARGRRLRELRQRQQAAREALEERQAQRRQQLRQAYRQDLQRHHLMTRREAQERRQADHDRRSLERARERAGQPGRRQPWQRRRHGQGGDGGR